MRRPLVLAGLAVLLLRLEGPMAEDTLPSKSQSTLQKYLDVLDVDTSLRGSYWSSDRDLTDLDHMGVATVWLKAQPKWSDSWVSKFEGWISDQRLFNGENTKAELREGYLAYLGERFALRAGRQIVVWGRTDRINPTDNISSRNFRLLFPEDDDLRRGNLMLRLNYAVNDYNSVSALWLPEFRPNLIPIDTRVGVERIPNVDRFDPAQFAVRFEHSGGEFDWSLSYFEGIDRNADLGLNIIAPNQAEPIWRFHRIRAVGADFATNIGRYGLRGEATYVMTQDRNGDNPEIKNPFSFVVMGGDRTFFDYLNVNLQYLFRYTENFHTSEDISNQILRQVGLANSLLSGQVHRYQHGLSLRVNYLWLNETLETELGGLALFNDVNFVLRPKITYKLTDSLRATLGADSYSGNQNTILGRLKDNSVVYFELRYGY